jgi:MFS family permease
MTVKSTTVNMPCTLVEELVARSRFSWLQVAVAVGLALILFLVGTAFLAGVLAAPFDASFWRAGMLYPAIIVYILLMLPLLKRLRDGAIESFRPLARMDDDDFEQLLAEAPMFNRRLEWLALGSGIVGGLLLWRPWDYSGLSTIWLSSGARSEWLMLYMLTAGGLWGGLLGWTIYSSLSGMRLFTGLQHHPLNINVFDLRPLQPIGRWSLGIAVLYIGGSALSLLFVPQMTLNVEAIVLYGILILTPVLVFFLNMLSTRQTIVAAKRRHLDMVRDNLAAASVALEEGAAKGQPEYTDALLESAAAWITYEERVEKVPEWPYTADIRRNLVLSTLLPLAVWLAREVVLDFLVRLLP